MEALPEPRLPRAARCHAASSPGALLHPERRGVSAGVRVCVGTRVCASHILHPPSPRCRRLRRVCPARRPPRVPGLEGAHAAHGISPAPLRCAPKTPQQGGSFGTAALRRRHTPPNDRQKKKVRLREHPQVPVPVPREEPRSSALERRPAPSIALPSTQNFSKRRRGCCPAELNPREQPLSGPGKKLGAGGVPAHLDAAHPRGSGVPRAAPGARRLSAKLGTAGARAAGHAVGAGGAGRVRRCGSGARVPPLLPPRVSAGGGLSRPGRSAPHATD